MKKRLLVIGGVAAGPKAAARARRNLRDVDHNIHRYVYRESGS